MYPPCIQKYLCCIPAGCIQVCPICVQTYPRSIHLPVSTPPQLALLEMYPKRIQELPFSVSILHPPCIYGVSKMNPLKGPNPNPIWRRLPTIEEICTEDQ